MTARTKVLSGAIAALICAGTLVLSAGATVASAAYSQPAASYKGIATTVHHCDAVPAGGACTTIYMTHHAWRWTGSAWQYRAIGEGANVYAWPSPWAGWHWAYTSTDGWRLMYTKDLRIPANQITCVRAPCPQF